MEKGGGRESDGEIEGRRKRGGGEKERARERRKRRREIWQDKC